MLFGGIAPISTSRIVPPPSAVTNDSTSNPNTSSPAYIPASAPSTANTNVPIRSITSSSKSWLYLGNFAVSQFGISEPPPSPPPYSRTGHTPAPPAHAPSHPPREQ